jgi:uncharacterized caspase-like protein
MRRHRNVAPPLNSRNNANDIAASLTRLNFRVHKVIDGTFDDLRRALIQFGRDAVGADMAPTIRVTAWRLAERTG